MKYTSRDLRRRGDSDKWEVTLTHDDPYTGDSVRTYHTIEAKTEKQARKIGKYIGGVSPSMTFTVEQLELMLAEARRREKALEEAS